MDQPKEATARAAGCAACNHMRQKCPPNCIFAPYFPANSPSFDYVFRAYGCSNVGKILQSLPVEQRRIAAESLAFEAEARIHDPLLGCVGYIYLLQQHLAQLDRDIQEAEAQIYAAGFQPPPPPLDQQHWYQMPQLTTLTVPQDHEQSEDFPYTTVAAYPSMAQAETFPQMLQPISDQLLPTQIDHDIQEAEVQIYAAGYQPPSLSPPLEQHWYQMPQLTTMTVPPHHEQSDDFLYSTVGAYPSMAQAEPFPQMPQPMSELLPIPSTLPQDDDDAHRGGPPREIPSTMPQQDEMTETEIHDYAAELEEDLLREIFST